MGNLHLVPARRQRLGHILKCLLLDPDLAPAQPLPARGVEGGLGVEAEVHQVHHHLHVSLGLHIAAHDPKGPKGLVSLADKARNDGVEGVQTLAGQSPIGAPP